METNKNISVEKIQTDIENYKNQLIIELKDFMTIVDMIEIEIENKFNLSYSVFNSSFPTENQSTYITKSIKLKNNTLDIIVDEYYECEYREQKVTKLERLSLEDIIKIYNDIIN